MIHQIYKLSNGLVLIILIRNIQKKLLNILKKLLWEGKFKLIIDNNFFYSDYNKKATSSKMATYGC